MSSAEIKAEVKRIVDNIYENIIDYVPSEKKLEKNYNNALKEYEKLFKLFD
jgi:ATP-dependent Zn protease